MVPTRHIGYLMSSLILYSEDYTPIFSVTPKVKPKKVRD